MIRARKALQLVAIPALTLALLGAEGGCGSEESTPDGVTIRGNVLLGRCSHRISAPYVDQQDGKIRGYADVKCREAVIRHTMTIGIQRRNANGAWIQQGNMTYPNAPALNALKKGTVGIACVPGVYRTTLKAFAQLVKEPDGKGDSGESESPSVTVAAKDCG
ncbi:hypothetical protein [Streptomyces sp. NBC_01304]|uniref:hypothetical protein n=1 Tax=Streptomyces sp. NBC_01304 TaxID=2903818 RepID=UPI002E1300CB|nr:hypothetical protein OG430_42955 [Streptomyces sp. NBC_01304]